MWKQAPLFREKRGTGLKKYICLDMERVLRSWRFLISIIGVAAIFYIFGAKPYEGYSLIEMYQFNIYQIQTLLVYIFCILPYGDGICQDMECRFYQLMIIRGKVFNYGLSKAFAIFLSSALTMILGTALYILIVKIQYNELIWVSENYIRGAFSSFISNEMYIPYFILCSIQMGLLTGILALLCAVASLYIVNKLFLYSLPIISYYTLCYLSEIIFGDYGFHWIYSPLYTIHSNEFLSFMITLIISCILFAILVCILDRKLKRRLNNG